MKRTNTLPQEVYSSLPQVLDEVTCGFTGHEKDLVFLSSLTTLGACLPNIYGIYGGKKSYPHLYFMTIAGPASGKSSMLLCKGLIQAIHQSYFNESQNNLAKFREMDKKRKEKLLPPPFQTKLIPANISSAELYNLIATAPYGALIIESEADTLSQMLKQDWSDFSALLRCAWEFEPLSIARKGENLHLEIEEPRLSLVLSGTPDQLEPLIKSVDNGLFSRFLFYAFDDEIVWKSRFTSKIDQSTLFKSLGNTKVYSLFQGLKSFEKEIEFRFTKEQENLLDIKFIEILGVIKERRLEGFIPCVKRAGAAAFRIAMILSGVRLNKENVATEIVCSDSDFQCALQICSHLLKHALELYESTNSTVLPDHEAELLLTLGIFFTRSEFIKNGKTLGYQERSLDKKLKQFCAKKYIRKLRRGQYQQLI